MNTSSKPTNPRDCHVLELPKLSSWPDTLERSEAPFVLFIAADVTATSPADLRNFAHAAVGQGAVYVCAWGPGCDRMETAFDLARVEAEMEAGRELPILMTTSHVGESLAEAAWFSLAVAFPAPEHGDIPFSWVGACFGEPDWARQLRAWMADPATLRAAVGL